MASIFACAAKEKFINYGVEGFVSKQPIDSELTPQDYPSKKLAYIGDPASVYFHEQSQTWARITIEADHESCVLTGFPSYEAAMENNGELRFYRETPMPSWLT